MAFDVPEPEVSDYELEQELAVKRRDGSLLQLKARLGVEALLDVLIRKGISLETPDALRLQIYDRLVELGDAKPKPNLASIPGAGFAVQIVMPGGMAPQTIAAARPAAPVIDQPTGESLIPQLAVLSALDELGPTPPHVLAAARRMPPEPIE